MASVFPAARTAPKTQSLRPWTCLLLFEPVRRTFFQALWVLFFFLFHFFCSLLFCRAQGYRRCRVKSKKWFRCPAWWSRESAPTTRGHRSTETGQPGERVGKAPKLSTPLWVTQPGMAVKSGVSLEGGPGRGPKFRVLPSSTKCCVLPHHHLLPGGPVTP